MASKVVLALTLFLTLAFASMPRPWNDPEQWALSSDYVDYSPIGFISLNLDYTHQVADQIVTELNSTEFEGQIGQKAEDCLSSAIKVKNDYEKAHKIVEFTSENTIRLSDEFVEEVRDRLRHLSDKELKELKESDVYTYVSSPFGFSIEIREEKDENNKTHEEVDLHLFSPTYTMSLSKVVYLTYFLNDFVSISSEIVLEGLLGWMSYGQDYVNMLNTCSDLVDAVEMSIDENTKALASNYSFFEHAGMCREDYNGYGGIACIKLKNYYFLITNNSNHSNEVSAANLLNEIHNTAYDDVVSFEGIGSLLNLAYKSNEEVNSLIHDAELGYENAVADVKGKHNIYIQKRNQVSNLLRYAEKEKFYLIKGGVITQDIFSVDISEEVEEANELFNNAESEFELSKSSLNSNQQDWLFYAYSYAVDSLVDVDRALFKLSNAKQGAKEVVDALRDLVLSKLSQLNNTDVSGAVEEVEKGDRAAHLGDKFLHYENALEIINAITPEEWEVDAAKIVAEVEDLLKRARDDGLNVGYEESLFNTFKDEENTTFKVQEMLFIKESILTKAKARFGYLPQLRQELLYYINNGNGMFDYLHDQMLEAESGIVINGMIDYEKGLGRLKALEQTYQQLLNEIKAKIGSLSNYLKVDVNVNSGIPTANEEEVIEGSIIVTNPFGFEIKDIEIRRKLNLPLSSKDIEGASYENGEVVIRIPLLKPYESRIFKIHKKFIWVELSSVERYFIGRNGNGYRIFDLIVNVKGRTNGFYLDKDYDECYINGKKTDGKRVLGRFEAGLYEGNATVVVEGAYDVNESVDVKRDGTKNIELKTLTIKPYYDFDWIDIPLHDFELESIDKEYELHSSFVRIMNVKEDEEVKVVLKKEVEDVDSAIQALAEKISALNKTVEEEQMFESIMLDYENGKDKYAVLEQLEELYNKITGRINEEQKCLSKAGEYLSFVESELRAINEAINGSSDDLLDIFISRRNALNELKSRVHELSPCDKLVELRKYDKRWTEKEIVKWANAKQKEVSSMIKELRSSGDVSKELDSLISQFTSDYFLVKAGENDFRPAVKLQNDYYAIKEYYDSVKSSQSQEDINEVEDEIEELEESIENIRESINQSPEVESYLSFSLDSAKKQVSLANNLLKEGKLEAARNEIKSLREKLEKAEKVLKKESERRLNKAKVLYSSASRSLDEEARKNIEGILNEIEQSINKKEYGKALSLSSDLIKRLELLLVKKKQGNSLVLIGIAIGGLILLATYYKILYFLCLRKRSKRGS